MICVPKNALLLAPKMRVSANEPSDEPNWELRKVRFPLAFLARCFCAAGSCGFVGICLRFLGTSCTHTAMSRSSVGCPCGAGLGAWGFCGCSLSPPAPLRCCLVTAARRTGKGNVTWETTAAQRCARPEISRGSVWVASPWWHASQINCCCGVILYLPSWPSKEKSKFCG